MGYRIQHNCFPSFHIHHIDSWPMTTRMLMYLQMQTFCHSCLPGTHSACYYWANILDYSPRFSATPRKSPRQTGNRRTDLIVGKEQREWHRDVLSAWPTLGGGGISEILGGWVTSPPPPPQGCIRTAVHRRRRGGNPPPLRPFNRKIDWGIILSRRMMILRGVGHPISCFGVCYPSDPQKGGTAPAPALDLTTSLRRDFVLFSF